MELLKQMLGESEKPQPKEERPKLLTRSGSDPKFDNVAYQKKVQDQTLRMLKGMGVPVDELL